MAEENKNKKEGKKDKGLMIALVFALLVIGGASGFAYWKISGSRVETDEATISAPVISLAPTAAGLLEEVDVNVGDQVAANTVVARVGNELIKTKVAGIVSATQDNVGKLFSPSETVVSLYDPQELRLVGRVDENKGLSAIRVGQKATFTVDAFGSKKYEGVVDEISPISREGDVVFNISDKRETKEFEVKIRFDLDKYPELKNGMSAKLTIYK